MSENRIKTEEEIESMRTSGHILASVLQAMREETQAGMTPKDMSALAAKELRHP